MEIIAPNLPPKAALLDINTQFKALTPNPKALTQLPLCRPEYKPVRAKPPTRKRNPQPVSSTSDILRLMDGLKLPIPLDIYSSLIKECTESGDPFKAIELHEHISGSRIRLNLPLINRLLLMLVTCGCFGHARQLFDKMSLRDFNSWVVVIAGSVENGECDEAVRLFVRMLRDKDLENVGETQMGFSVPGIVMCVLKACLCLEDFELGRQVHGWLWKMGYSRNAALSSFLINFYGKMKCSEGAQSVFEQVRCSNTAVWTSRIVNCCSYDNFEGVIDVFKEMGGEGVRKNGYTFSTVIKACGRMGDVGCGRQVHANAMKLGLESDAYVQCALVDFYGKCGFISDATRMFEIGRNKNSACFNAMLTNCMQHGLHIEALKILYEMKVAGFKPRESMFNEVRFVCGSRVLRNNMEELKL